MTMSAAYPKKLFYKIQEVANIIGVEPYVLRYWETKFPMLSPEKDSNDQRRYRQKDIELLLRVRELLHVEKYTIAGAVEKLKEESSSGRRESPKQPSASSSSEVASPLMLEPELPPEVDSATNAFEPGSAGLNDEQRETLRRVKDELGLLRRELEDWRDELG